MRIPFGRWHHERMVRLHKWHRWFAWYPIFNIHGDFVWLQTVWRSCSWGDFTTWHYNFEKPQENIQ